MYLGQFQNVKQGIRHSIRPGKLQNNLAFSLETDTKTISDSMDCF